MGRVQPQNVQLHNVQLSNVHLQNVQNANCPGYKMPILLNAQLQNAEYTKRFFCKWENLLKQLFNRMCQIYLVSFLFEVR